MFRLVKTDPATARKLESGDRTPRGFLHVRTVDAFLREGRHLGFQIFAHEVEFVYVIFIGRMERGLSRRHREDQPAVAGVHGRESKDVPKKGAVSGSILAINDHVSARDHKSSPKNSAICRSCADSQFVLAGVAQPRLACATLTT